MLPAVCLSVLPHSLTRQQLNVVTSELAATESHVNMRMDEARNRLLRLEVWLNAFVSILAPGALVSGIFGMNLMVRWQCVSRRLGCAADSMSRTPTSERPGG